MAAFKLMIHYCLSVYTVLLTVLCYLPASGSPVTISPATLPVDVLSPPGCLGYIWVTLSPLAVTGQTDTAVLNPTTSA